MTCALAAWALALFAVSARAEDARIARGELRGSGQAGLVFFPPAAPARRRAGRGSSRSARDLPGSVDPVAGASADCLTSFGCSIDMSDEASRPDPRTGTVAGQRCARIPGRRRASRRRLRPRSPARLGRLANGAEVTTCGNASATHWTASGGGCRTVGASGAPRRRAPASGPKCAKGSARRSRTPPPESTVEDRSRQKERSIQPCASSLSGEPAPVAS